MFLLFFERAVVRGCGCRWLVGWLAVVVGEFLFMFFFFISA